MSWNYRVTRTHVTTPDGPQNVYEIREAYYDENGQVTSWSENPIAPYGETWHELAEDLVKMQRAISMAIIDLTGEKPIEVSLREVDTTSLAKS